MAFMRDPIYILMQDGTVHIHLTGVESSWGSPIPQPLFDEIVMMRYYNMAEEERRAAINRAIATQCETGADGIRKASGLPTVMERLMQKSKETE